MKVTDIKTEIQEIILNNTQLTVSQREALHDTIDKLDKLVEFAEHLSAVGS